MTSSVPLQLRLGTRGSQLALYQARTVAALLAERTGSQCEIVIIKTSGDRLSEAPLSEIGGKRLFVKEIEDALLAGEIDLAVHSSKDMPAVLPEGLEIGAVLPREEARDAMVLPLAFGHPETLEDLIAQVGREPRIGTSSIRRTAQLIRLFPGAAFAPIRGNLDTRLRKLDSGDFDAIVLAAAGLHRLEQRQRVSALLPVHACVPAPGQGIIAIEMRQNDAPVRELLLSIDDPAAAQALVAERMVVTRLGGGCQMPIGAYAEISGDTMEMTAVVLAPDGDRAVRSVTRGPAVAAADVGHAAADELLEQGAAEILANIGGDAAVKGLQP